ncbi:hypothetical protein F5B21DRAFT_509140 [Xylaria acuta]|nr:hypothetical protein F5B21DRAFT_509140 [Xylaria acuta]
MFSKHRCPMEIKEDIIDNLDFSSAVDLVECFDLEEGLLDEKAAEVLESTNWGQGHEKKRQPSNMQHPLFTYPLRHVAYAPAAAATPVESDPCSEDSNEDSNEDDGDDGHPASKKRKRAKQPSQAFDIGTASRRLHLPTLRPRKGFLTYETSAEMFSKRRAPMEIKQSIIDKLDFGSAADLAEVFDPEEGFQEKKAVEVLHSFSFEWAP